MGFQINNRTSSSGDNNPVKASSSSKTEPSKGFFSVNEKKPSFFGRTCNWLKNLGSKKSSSLTKSFISSTQENALEQKQAKMQGTGIQETAKRVNNAFVIENPLFSNTDIIPLDGVYEDPYVKEDYGIEQKGEASEHTYAALQPKEEIHYSTVNVREKSKNQTVRDNQTVYTSMESGLREKQETPSSKPTDIYAKIKKVPKEEFPVGEEEGLYEEIREPDSRFYTEEETHHEEINLDSKNYVSARDARREFYEAEGQESTPSFLEESKIGKFTRTPMPSTPPVPPQKSNKYNTAEKKESIYDEFSLPQPERGTKVNKDYESMYDRVTHTEDENIYESPAPSIPERKSSLKNLDEPLGKTSDSEKTKKRAVSSPPPLPTQPPPSSKRKAHSFMGEERDSLKKKNEAYFKQLDADIEDLKKMAQAEKAKRQPMEDREVPDLERLDEERENLLGDYDDFVDPLKK